MSKRKILILHGPNMMAMGAQSIDTALAARANALGVALISVQSNAEAGLIDAVHLHSSQVDAIIVNPGAVAPIAYGLAEALELVAKPAIEVLMSKIPVGRGPSALTPVVSRQIHGKGIEGYLLALEVFGRSANRIHPRATEAPASPPVLDVDFVESNAVPQTVHMPTDAAGSGPPKTLGRRPTSVSPTIEGALPTEVLSRELVKHHIQQRLAKKIGADALAAWARTQWSRLNRDEPSEPGYKELLESVLLTLMAGANTTDHVLLAQIVKLDQ